MNEVIQKRKKLLDLLAMIENYCEILRVRGFLTNDEKKEIRLLYVDVINLNLDDNEYVGLRETALPTSD